MAKQHKDEKQKQCAKVYKNSVAASLAKNTL